MVAAMKGHTEIVEMLANKGANVNAIDDVRISVATCTVLFSNPLYTILL